LNRQVAEAEDKANRLFEQQEKRKRDMKEAIDKSRALQVQRKRAEDGAKKQEEKDFAEFWRIRNEELQLAEQQEKEEEKQRARELSNFIKTQGDAKQAKAIKEFQVEQTNAIKTQALLDQQEKNFYSYAEQAISEWQGQGKNVKPLIMELKNYKKRIV